MLVQLCEDNMRDSLGIEDSFMQNLLLIQLGISSIPLVLYSSQHIPMQALVSREILSSSLLAQVHVDLGLLTARANEHSWKTSIA